MKYDKLYDEFLELFKDDTARIRAIANAMNVDQTDGMHVAFGMVIVPYVEELVKEHEEEKTKNAFVFFEKMALSGNTLINEVLEFTVLEDFISKGDDFLKACKKYMGRETLAACEAVEKYM